MTEISLSNLVGVWAAAFSLNFLLGVLQDIGRRALGKVLSQYESARENYPKIIDNDEFISLQEKKRSVESIILNVSILFNVLVLVVCVVSLSLIIYSSFNQSASLSLPTSIVLVAALLVAPPLTLVALTIFIRRKARYYSRAHQKYVALMERRGAHKDTVISVSRYANAVFPGIRMRYGGSKFVDYMQRFFFRTENIAIDSDMEQDLKAIQRLTGKSYEESATLALGFVHLLIKLAEEDPESRFVVRRPDGSESSISNAKIVELLKCGANSFEDIFGPK